MCREPFVCVALAWLLAAPVLAQEVEVHAPHVTLEGWVHDLRVAAWDRSGAVGGMYFDRGVFRYRTPRMDHEYGLDKFTVGFTLAEDADFYAYRNGFRSRAVSVTTSDFAALTQLHVTTPLGEFIDLRIDAELQDDFEARRLALRLGYEVEVVEGHRVGFAHSLARAKPDMDFGLYYRYQGAHGLVAEAEVAALDGLNNMIDGLTASPFNRDTLRNYSTAPYMFTARIASRIVPRFRGEVALGVQSRSVANVRSLSHDSLRFTYEDAFRYAGFLVEGDAWPGHLTTGAVAQFTSSTTTRRADPDALNPADYTTRQPYSRLGAFALGRWGRMHAEAWLYYDHYTDEQEGTLFGGASIDGPYLFEETRTWLRAEVGAVTGVGLGATISYLADLRSFPKGEGLDDRYLAFIPHRPNHRLTLKLSYHFSDRAVFDGGASLDLDNDHFFPDPTSRSRYDGIYLRLRANW